MPNNYAERYTELVGKYQGLSGRLEEKKNRQKELQVTIKETEEALQLREDAIEIVEVVNQFYQEKVFSKIDELVTQALRVILDDDSWEFKTKLDYKRSQPEAYFEPSKISEGRKIKGDLLFINGGGFVDIVSCALRLITAELSHRPGFICLDEPARMLSASYLSNFAKFIYEYSHKTDRQIIMITHASQLASIADKGFNVTQDGSGVSHVAVIDKG